VSIRDMPHNAIRFDLNVIASWIDSGSRVLDLGCGEGELLSYLNKHKEVDGTGIDQNECNVSKCIEKGISVIQGDINKEVKDYTKHAFDYVVLSQTLQQVYAPSELIQSLLHIGKKVIVSFPNFSHFGVRLQLLLKGHAPKTSQLPWEWYNTPNIRVITMKDFRQFGKKIGFTIYKEAAISTHHQDKQGKIIRLFKNILATYGIFLIGEAKNQ
jgi:methionine biosynthesis protein MetW